MSLDRLRYELRLLGKPVFLTPLLVVSGFALFMALVNRGVTPYTMARALGASLEMLLPMAAGVVVATIATHDRAIELQLTMPRSYHRTANARFLFILLWSALIALLTSALLLTLNHWRLPTQIVHWGQPWQFLTWQLTWLSSMLWLVAFGLVLSLLLRSRSASGALIGVFAIMQVMFHSGFDEIVFLHPVYLFPLTFTPDANYWLTNRVELLGTAAVLLVLAWFLLRKSELLLLHAPGEE
ncbi:MAG TPA: hypothetical protein VN729_11325 [Ktedonobacteraceae bacterium]|nr:hypothetical protein [Ktedonobacteraceae bacterium]